MSDLEPELEAPLTCDPPSHQARIPNPSPERRQPHRLPTREESARAKTITTAYCALQPLSNARNVQTVIAKAIMAKRWNDGEILNALTQLARDDRRVTPETLRVELMYRIGARREQRVRGELKPESVVYLIKAAESSLTKIGTSEQTQERLYNIQLMCPVQLRILCEIPGGYELESALHGAFRSRRRHGEWFDFRNADPVETVLRRLPLVLRKMGVDSAPVLAGVRIAESEQAAAAEVPEDADDA